jgi:hypothetical protein
VYVNVGRREGARAADFQRVLTERAGIDKADVRRIRVRERNAFVSVPRGDLARAVEALDGATIGGKTVSAEPARERGAEGEAEPRGADEAPREPVAAVETPVALTPPAPAEGELAADDQADAESEGPTAPRLPILGSEGAEEAPRAEEERRPSGEETPERSR